MQIAYESFLESLAESVDERDLVRSMTILLDAFDIGKFAYIEISSQKERSPRLVSNYPLGWTSLYLRNQYEVIDPVVLSAHRTKEPFCWGSRFQHDSDTEDQLRLFDEAAEFGIRNGLTVPIHDRRGRVAALTFATDESHPTLLRTANRYHRAFQLIATCFHIHARRMRPGARQVDGVQLTRREYECLQWSAKGKSAWEIGQILGITRRTVAFHLDNAKGKFGVRTVAQAVARLASSNGTSK